MSAFHQMGHDSRNLVFEPPLADFAGQILSPVNETPTSMAAHLKTSKERLPHQRLIFDPQLYLPAQPKGDLKSWSYYPADGKSHDTSDVSWWETTLQALVESAKSIGTHAICSPAPMTRHANRPEYHAECADISAMLVEALDGTGIEALHTALVDMPSLDTKERVIELASIITRSPCAEIYLLFDAELEPRKEIRDSVGLVGAMRLIQALRAAGRDVTVGMCSTDQVLWKAAGATHCASGKFFNLRRFTEARWDDSKDGGAGQLGYWMEEGLLAFLREPDLLLAEQHGLITPASLANPFAPAILQKAHAPGEHPAWVAESWRYYLWWFKDFERRIQSLEQAEAAVLTANSTWERVDKMGLDFTEQHNDGRWVRAWVRALAEFRAG